MTKLNLELDIDQTNLILEALGQLPFARVYTLIQLIQEQGREQIAARQIGPNGAERRLDDE